MSTRRTIATGPSKEEGETLPLLDGMIAATALQHDLTIATRSTRDFSRAGAKVFDPFA